MKRKLLALLLACVLINIFIEQSATAQCHPSADFATMDHNFLAYLRGLSGKENEALVLIPFYDDAAGTPDPVLSRGIPFLIYDFFSEKNAPLVHPFVGQAATDDLGLSGVSLTDPKKIAEVAKKINAGFVLFGSYTRSNSNMVRVTLNIYEQKTGLVLAPAVEFETNFDDSFFAQLKNHFTKATERVKGLKKFKDSGVVMPSMQNFRYYSKGLELSSRYDVNHLQLSTLWFEKALKESYQRYDDAALELARSYFMLGLIDQMQKSDPSQNWVKAQQALTHLTYRPKESSGKYLVTLRYLLSHAESVKAMSAYMAKNTGDAMSFAAGGLAYVPEDGILQYLYSTVAGAKKVNGITLNDLVCF